MSDNPPANQATSDSLGLDLATLKVSDAGATDPKKAPKESATSSQSTSQPSNTQANADAGDAKESPAAPDAKPSEPKEKKKPYVNPERVLTGGTQRDKLSEDELALRMARMREQNEKIKQRRMDVQADEDEYKKTQEVERAKAAKQKKVQENVDRAREQNARRKMDKITTREWDTGKKQGEWKPPKKAADDATEEAKPQPSIGIRGAVRGGGRGGGRGQPRGRGGANATSPRAEKKEESAPAAAPTTSAPPPAKETPAKEAVAAPQTAKASS